MSLGGAPHSLDSKLSHCSQALHGTRRRDVTVSSLFLLEKLPFFSCFGLHPPRAVNTAFPRRAKFKAN